MRFLFSFCTLLICTVTWPASAQEVFSDVPMDHPNHAAIEYVYKEEIVSGYPDGTFQPDQFINRAELTKIMVGSTAPGTAPIECDDGAPFEDVQTDTWFGPYVCVAKRSGTVSGYPDGSFKPAYLLNFVEAAKIISEALGRPDLEEPTNDKEWFKPYTRFLDAHGAIPGSITTYNERITRGEVAEILYRLQVEITDAPATPAAALTFDPDIDSITVPILNYHHVRPTSPYPTSTWSYKMSVSPSIFEKQMDWLVERGYTTITLDDFAAIMNGQTAGPPKPVVITFDDNNYSQYELAFPILRDRGQIAVFYLVANRLDNESVVGRKHLAEMIEAGMDIQSHTMTHAGMPALSVEQMDWQLKESKRVLEEATGKPVRHIAYPLTAHNATVRERTRLAGYTTGTIMDPRAATETSDFYKLPRIMMTDTTDLARVLP